tara:strand:- start:238 stop:801 length:564 start_codon:yes stop_codon:yes gene_type:complete
MKKFLAILILILTFQTPSQADDIRDFQIEGMSVGDSLLDYFSLNEISENTNNELKIKGVIAVNFSELPSFKTFDDVLFYLMKNDKKYIIYGISGRIYYDENIDACYRTQNEIDKELSKFFINAKRVEKPEIEGYREDPSSRIKQIFYDFVSRDYIVINCVNYKKWSDTLEMSLITSELYDKTVINFY